MPQTVDPPKDQPPMPATQTAPETDEAREALAETAPAGEVGVGEAAAAELAGDGPVEEHPGWMRRLGRNVSGFLRRFRALVDRRPWLALMYKITIGAIGTIVIIAGILMLVLPGPGWLTIFLGLAIMGTEFAWARRLLTWLRLKVRTYADRYRAWRKARAERKRAA